MERCPHCSEWVEGNAIVCKRCHRQLSARDDVIKDDLPDQPGVYKIRTDQDRLSFDSIDWGPPKGPEPKPNPKPKPESKPDSENISKTSTIEMVPVYHKKRGKAYGFFGWRNFIICPNPNCGYEGKPVKKARGSTGCLLFLILFAIICCLTIFLSPVGIPLLIIALLYGLFKGGYNYVCPQCGMQVRSDH